MTRTIISVATVILAAATVSAQMIGPGRGGPMHPPNTSPAGGGYGGGMGMGRLHEIVVAADGTVLAIKRGTDDVQLVAVNPSGAQAWTHTFTTGIHRFELAGELVLIATGNAPRDWRERPPQSPRTGLIALNLSNGSQAWSLDIDGMVSAIEPAANAIFAVVTDPPDDGGAGQRRQGTRKLMALSRSGAILWTFPLN